MNWCSMVFFKVLGILRSSPRGHLGKGGEGLHEAEQICIYLQLEHLHFLSFAYWCPTKHTHTQTTTTQQSNQTIAEESRPL